jgi:hypothetical protein
VADRTLGYVQVADQRPDRDPVFGDACVDRSPRVWLDESLDQSIIPYVVRAAAGESPGVRGRR